MKKIFYGSLGLFILVLIFLGAYNFAFKNNVNNPVADEEKKLTAEKNAEETTILSPSGKVENTLNEKILGAVIGGGSLFYYSLDDKSLKRATLDGKNKTILLSNLPGVPTRIIWSPKRDRLLLSLKQMSGGTVWYFSNVSQKTIAPLKPEISRLSWDNLGDKIFYQFTDSTSGNRTLNIANPDGSDWRKLADIGTHDNFIASVPQSSAVSFWDRPLAGESSSLETVSITGENKKTLFSGKFGADFLWSPTGEDVLISASEARGDRVPSLYLMKSSGGEVKNLSVPTLISKAVWSKDGRTIYYALPGSLPESALLPDDYFAKPLYTKDTFWKIDTETGTKTRLIDLDETNQNFDSIDLLLSQNEDYFYFTDRLTQKLFRIEL